MAVNRLITVYFFLLVHIPTYSQNYIREINTIPFRDSTTLYQNTFSGGINNYEHQFIDIDGDGDYDLFYLDSDGTYGWYENVGTSVNPDFKLSLEQIEGLHFSNWFYFVDIDNDDDFDLFTSSNGNYISLYINVGTPFHPSFQLSIDTLKDINDEPILSEFSSNPIFVDIDNDGDFDFVSGNSAGTLTFYENIGTTGSFNFKYVTNEWQNILIISGGNNSKHGASSIEFVDIDNDGDYDMFWGDFFSKSLYYFENTGNANSPAHSLHSSIYPNNNDSLYTSGFNMPRFVDIDGDGDSDLFVTVLYDPTVKESFIFYENVGNPILPNFQRKSYNYLNSLDVGSRSLPVFLDIDDDGDKDLFIGAENNPNGTIYFYENIGTKLQPSFILRTNKFEGIEDELSIAPAFGDIDGDEDYDLVIGNLFGNVSLYRNIGNKTTPEFVFDTKLRDNQNNLITAGSFARPFLFDVNNDGDLDLIVGGFNGRLILYENIGTNTNYLFAKNLNYFGDIDVGDMSAPFLVDIDGDSIPELWIGNRTGLIKQYKNTGSLNSPIWIEHEVFLNHFSFGGDAAPSFIDIDGDTDLDFFLGNIKGGLYFFRNNIINSIKNNDGFLPDDFYISNCYPNPFNSSTSFLVFVTVEQYFNIYIYSLMGEEVEKLFDGNLSHGQHSFTWDSNNPNNISSSGIYFIVVKAGQLFKTIKVILLK
ncbi:MAG: T9SS type A sorting domain-containing protein [Ignavibacteria bacterium]|nr:T9SS type A sorting domain-containing protein [Ignavibacteria bacterium]